MSVEAPDRGPDKGRKIPAEAPAFSREYVDQLYALKERMERPDDGTKEKADAKVENKVYEVLNSSANSFLLVKSEIAKSNFLDGSVSAFITEPVYQKFAKSPEGKAFFSKVIKLGTQALEAQYTNGYKSEEQRFVKAVIAISKDPSLYPENNGDPTVRRVLQIAEMLNKSPLDVTFNDAVKTGLLGIKPPSVEEIVKYGVTALEYADPKSDRKQYDEIKRRRRMVESTKVTDVLLSDDAKTLTLKKQQEAEKQMQSLNDTRKSLDGDIKNLVDDLLSKKEGDVRFYTLDGSKNSSLNPDLTLSAKQMPTIVIARGAEPIGTITVVVRNGRTVFELKDANAKLHYFFDANVKADRKDLVSRIRVMLDFLGLPDKKAPEQPKSTVEKKPRTPQEDADMKWMESLKDNPMELTEENIQHLVSALRSTEDIKPNLRIIQLRFKYDDKKGGLGIQRFQDPNKYFSYIASYKLPPASEQKDLRVTGPLDAKGDKEVGTKLYWALIDSLEGREPSAELPSEKKQTIAKLAGLAEKMDKRNWTQVTQEELEVRFRGQDATLIVRKEVVPNAPAMPEVERGHVVYRMGLIMKGDTTMYRGDFITDRPLVEDWNDLGAKLYQTLEKAVDKKKK